MDFDPLFWLRALAMVSGVGYLEWRRRRKAAAPLVVTPPREPEISEEPDLPLPFGYKSIWLTVPSSSSKDVLDALGIEHSRVSSWRSGLHAAASGQVFVTPPLDGWVAVVGSSLPQIGEDETERALQEILRRLSGAFGQACYFASHRVVEYHAWAKFVGGDAVREFAYLGESGEVLADRGAPTAEEKRSAQVFSVDAVEAGRVPDEDSVLEVAAGWCFDPRQTRALAPYPSTGWVGSLR